MKIIQYFATTTLSADSALIYDARSICDSTNQFLAINGIADSENRAEEALNFFAGDSENITLMQLSLVAHEFDIDDNEYE